MPVGIMYNILVMKLICMDGGMQFGGVDVERAARPRAPKRPVAAMAAALPVS